MIIYRCVFDIVIGPFIGMMDDDELENELWDYVDTNDLEGFRLIIEKKILDRLKEESINFLFSKNIQVTLFYYLFCFGEENLIDNLKRDLIDFGTYFYIFKDVLISIFTRISENIGYLDMKCSDFIENDGHFHDIFKTREETLDYLNS